MAGKLIVSPGQFSLIGESAAECRYPSNPHDFSSPEGRDAAGRTGAEVVRLACPRRHAKED